MLKVAITGATGFVGGFVATYLESKGYEVYRFGRKEKLGVTYWDITSGVYLNDLKIDVVVHCAADVSDWSSYEKSFCVNVTGTKNVVASFSKTSIFIYISSGSVYSPYCKEKVITENVSVESNGLNNYGKTKLLGEKIVENSSIKSKVILRPHIIYGPGDTTIGPRIKKAIKSDRFIIPGNGKNHISFTHVENLASAINQSILYSKVGTSVYNIADAKSPTFNTALSSFKKLNNLKFKELYIPKSLSLIISNMLEFTYKIFQSKQPPLLTPYIVHQMTNDHIFDISKAVNEINYNPIKSYDKDFYID